MGIVTLDDILVTKLDSIETKSGNVLHALKASDKGATKFGEAYFSWIEFNAIKAWKKHSKMTMNIIVPVGRIKFAFCLDNKKEFRIEEIGELNYARLTIPPGIWFGFQGLSMPKNLLLDIADMIHDPLEIDRLEKNKINFNW